MKGVILISEKLNLYQKLAKIRGIAAVASKSKSGYNYSYVDLTEILANVTGGMDKYGVSLIPKLPPHTITAEPKEIRNVKVNRQGQPIETVTNETYIFGEMEYLFVDIDNPEDTLSIPWILIGRQPDPSQALGTSLTYSMRQFLCNFFQIAQVDYDIDAYLKNKKEAEEKEDKDVAKSIVEEIDIVVNKYLQEFPKERERVTLFLSGYVKKGDYRNIKEPKVAAKVLEDFKKEFTDQKKAVKSEPAKAGKERD